MNPNAVVVVASNYQQARIAAQQLELEDGWFYCSDYHQIMGMLPERAIFVRPFLSFNEIPRQQKIEEMLVYRCLRSRVEPEHVWT